MFQYCTPVQDMIACATSLTYTQLLECTIISILSHDILKFLFHLCTLSVLITYSVHNIFLFLSPSETTSNLCLSVYFSMLNLISQSCIHVSILAAYMSLSFPVFSLLVSAFYSLPSTFLFSAFSTWIYITHLQSVYVFVSPSSDCMYLYFQNFSPRKISQSLIYKSLYFTIISLHACMYLHFTIFILLCLYFPYLQSKCVCVLPHLYSTMHILYFPFFNPCTCIAQSYVYKSAFPSLQSIFVCIYLYFLILAVCLCISPSRSTMHVLPALLSVYLHFSVLGLKISVSRSSIYICLYLPEFPRLACMSLYFQSSFFYAYISHSSFYVSVFCSLQSI